MATRPKASLGLTRLEDRLTPAALDLSTHGAVGAVNGATFAQYDSRDGVALDTFLRIRDTWSGVSEGFNTDERPVRLDQARGRDVTHSIRLDAVPTVDVGGVPHKEFLLDVNEGVNQPRISLDELQVFVGSRGDLWRYNPSTNSLAGATKVYDLDAGAENNWVVVQDDVTPRAGAGDMLLYVPADLFSGNPFVYLYSRFGDHHGGNGGVEQWAVGVGGPVTPPVTPPPGENGTITGSVFEESDGSLVPLASGRVYIETTGDDVFNEGETVVEVVNGAFTFTGLADGTYRVLFVEEDGYIRLNQIAEVTVTAGGTVTTEDILVLNDGGGSPT
jgi:hypothetical protein